MITIIAFIVTIGILVTIHEFGHFKVARWCGVKVLKFSIGFGKPLWSKTFGKDNTEFVLAAIPLGGYVKMLDERELKEEENPVNYSESELKRAFNRQSVWKRIAIVLAGPLANLLLAIVLYWGLFMLGVTGMRPIIGVVEENSLAAQASLKSGEIIQKVAGNPVSTWQEARWALLEESLESKTVEIEATNNNKELLQHTLSFDGINDDAEIDVLKKIGLEPFKPNIPAVIGEILLDSAAEKAGFKPNDKILRIDGVEMDDWEQVVKIIKVSPNQKLQFEIERAQKIVRITATPESVEDGDEIIGRMGAGVRLEQAELNNFLIILNYSPLTSLQKAISKTWDTSIFNLKMLGKMLTGQVSLKGISGPVTIADYAGKSANLGLTTFLGFLALVSISIGVLNLLPIPVLDGGHLMYYIAEIFKGSPVSEAVMMTGQKIGFGILGLLMTIALFNDFNRLVAG
ncbi:MAG: RIP metalloprotease RseP [Methylotenera sp.]